MQNYFKGKKVIIPKLISLNQLKKISDKTNLELFTDDDDFLIINLEYKEINFNGEVNHVYRITVNLILKIIIQIIKNSPIVLEFFQLCSHKKINFLDNNFVIN